MVSLQLSDQNSSDASTYDIFNDDILVGTCQLRAVPTKSKSMPEGFENHIYYEIEPSFQGRGFATQSLKLLLQKAKEIGLSTVTITVRDSNISSRKVAENNGAVLVDQKTDANGVLYNKYSIRL